VTFPISATKGFASTLPPAVFAAAKPRMIGEVLSDRHARDCDAKVQGREEKSAGPNSLQFSAGLARHAPVGITTDQLLQHDLIRAHPPCIRRPFRREPERTADAGRMD